jgi:hypothetical protein
VLLLRRTARLLHAAGAARLDVPEVQQQAIRVEEHAVGALRDGGRDVARRLAVAVAAAVAVAVAVAVAALWAKNEVCVVVQFVWLCDVCVM